MGKKWTQEEINFLKNNYNNYTNIIIAEKLGRSVDSVAIKGKELGLSKLKISNEIGKDIIARYRNGEQITLIAKEYNLHPTSVLGFLKRRKIHSYINNRWTDEDIIFLKEHYATTSWDTIEGYLKRSRQDIYCKASELGLKRENYFWEDSEIELIINMYKQDCCINDIYDALNQKHTIRAIITKLHKLNIASQKNYWSEEEDELLIKYYDKIRLEELIFKFPNRTKEALINRAKKLNIKNVYFWSENEDQLIKDNYEFMGDMEMSEMMDNRTWRSVKWRREQLGLYRKLGNTIGTMCKSINNDICHSMGEKFITDYFIKNNINYIKDDEELRYKNYLTNDNTNRLFDWILFIGDEMIFVEYFGMYRKNPRCMAEEKYKINTDKKIHDCKIANINLFCIYPHHIEKNNAKIFIENLNKLQYKCIV